MILGRAVTYLYTLDPYERCLLGQGCLNMSLEFPLARQGKQATPRETFSRSALHRIRRFEV